MFIKSDPYRLANLPLGSLSQIFSDTKWLIMLGVITIFLTEFRWGLSFMAVLAPIFLLRFLNVSQSRFVLLQLFGILMLGYTLAIAKIATHPIPILSSPLFALPIALMHFCTYAFYVSIKDRITSPYSILIFPIAGTVFQWAISALTPFSSWGVSAYLFIDNLPLMQSLSLVGMAGLNFLFLWLAVCIESLIFEGWKPALRNQFSLILATYIGLFIWGNWRLDQPLEGQWETAAAIKTDWHVSMGYLDKPAQNSLFSVLSERTTTAAEAGAKVVVWTEVATMTRPANENVLIEKLKALARLNSIHLVAAYAVLLEGDTMQFENKYLWISSNGKIQHDYLKRHPVPGEPAVKGETIPVPVNSPMGLSSGAICFDFDFPAEALIRASSNVSFVALPSSDWKGINPIHTQMAAYRSIEGGFSILRATNLGLSGGINPYGQILARMDHFDHSNGIMLVQLPTQRIKTLYSQIGDLFVYLCLGIMILLSGNIIVKSIRTKFGA